MVQCPKCSTKLDIDFGTVTCPNCQSVVFVEFDGTAKVDEQSQEPDNSLPEPDLSAFDDAIAEDVFASGNLEPQEFANPDAFQIEPPIPQVELESKVVPVSSEPVSPDDPLGMSGYANSEFSQGKDGPFLFNLFINGLDSKEIRESLREAMNDSRFGWDSNHLLGQIRAGKLLIKNVSPVKASILVNRLKRLPLSISWEQHAITTVEKF